MTLVEESKVYDLFAPEALHDPYPLYHRMRAEDPVHFCLGAVLARMELTACFEALARRMPSLRFDPDREALARRTSLVFKGFETLPVRF